MNTNPNDVVVVGNVGIDTNIYPYAEEIDFGVESNFTRNIDYVGQAGGYTSRGYVRLGYSTGFIGHVGNDFGGDFIRQTFSADGIDSRALLTDPDGTARSVNLMYRDGRRKNFYDGKGHMSLEPDLNLCREVLSGARLAHFHLPNWARHLLPLARAQGLTIACDLQDVVDPHDPYRRDFIDQADILFFSAANFEDPASLIRQFLTGRPERIVVTGMGARGCALGTAEGVRFFPPVAMAAPVIDTNGAGDMLAVGFLSSYVLEGYSVEDALLRGQIAARHACTLKASSSGLISRRQLDTYHQSHRIEPVA
jgi:sugar/nucleoside kinase (ribokinase family)